MLTRFISAFNFLGIFGDGSPVPLKTMHVMELNNESFGRALSYNKILLVLFYLPTCSHCVKFRSTFNDMKSESDSVGWPVQFARVNVNLEEELADEFGIRKVPMIHVFKDQSRRSKVYKKEVNRDNWQDMMMWLEDIVFERKNKK